MTAKRYLAITMIMFAMIAIMFAIVISLQGEEVFADTTYTITWLNDDGTQIDTTQVDADALPTHANPEKASTVDTVYTFTGWTPTIVAATGDATYTATFSEAPHEYTITWKDEDGTTLATDSVAYGEIPTYTGATPTKASTAQYTYAFNGWSSEVVAVSADATYTATYTETTREYTITWENDDGTTLATDSVAYGETPTYTGATPTKASTAQYTYAFNGWSSEVVAVAADATYTATYIATTRTYTITWKNDNGETLETDENVSYGTTPSYDGATPTKASTAEYIYTFSGWSPTISDVTGDAIYTATYTQLDRLYTISWIVEGNEVKSVKQKYNTAIPEYGEENPTKVSDNYNTYTFSTWAKTPIGATSVTSDIAFTAIFTSSTRYYDIKWLNWDGEELVVLSLTYGEVIPEYIGETPQRAATEQYIYTFSGWDVQPEEYVSGNATYTATFTSTIQKYTITWLDWNNEIVDVFENVEYGENTPQNSEHITLERESTAQYSYIFDKWTPDVAATVSGDATYKATYTETLRQYTITWLDENGIDILAYKTLKYGETPEFVDEPTKASTAQYSYTFSGWTPTITAVTGDAIYTATYAETIRSYTINWINYDDSSLETDEDILYGEIPVYNGVTPTKESDERYDYTFIGWSPEVSEVTGVATYKAQFSATYILYKIEYTTEPGYIITVKNNGEIIASGATVTYDDEVVVSYTILAGYSDNNDFEIVGDDDTAYTRNENTLTNIHTNISISLTVTANTYVITFDQTGIDPMQQTSYQIKYAQKVILPIPTKEGHTFVCWKHNEDAFTDATGQMLGFYDVTGGITLVANFTANNYKIIYDEYVEKESEPVTYGANYTLEMPNRPGYVFEGWYYSTIKLTDIDCQSITAYLYAEDIEIESHWTEITIELNNYVLYHTYTYGSPFGITAIVEPQNASTVTYSVSVDGVIELEQDGNYRIVGIGQVVFRATLDNGGAYKECAISVADIFVYDDLSTISLNSFLYITINGEEYERKHAVVCEEDSKLSDISKEILEYLNISNAYVARTDIGIEVDPNIKFKDVFRDGDTLNINLIYDIEKATNTHVSYRLSAQTAEYGQKVYIEDLIAKEGYKLGNIIVTNVKDLDVEISQLERSFIMPSANVLVDVLLKNIVVESTNIANISIKSDIGIKSNAKFVVNSIDKNSYNQNISFSERKQAVYAMHVDYIEGDQALDYTEKYTIVMKVPNEFIGNDGMEVLYYQNGETIVKQIYIEGDTLSLTLAGAGDIVFISNIHGSTVYLYWLIIIMLFVDTLLGMILIILFINYQDALQRRRELNGYSTILPVLLLGAAIASEVAFLVFLGIIFLIELIGIAWLSLKLSNKYFIYTTYHKMSYVKPQDYNTVVKDIKDRKQNE